MKRDILYVDDELDNIAVFEATFEDDFNVTTATSAQEALALLEKSHFPVVVADQRMPEMSGVELFEILRHRHPHTKRIILTGYIDSASMLDAINKGQVFYFVTKPWDRNVMISVLIRAIEAHDLAVSNMALTQRLVASQRCAMLGQVAARVAHEMGNQLCMLPLLELIEEKYSGHKDLVEMADLAWHVHQRLSALVEEVKAFVRFENEDFPTQPLPLAEAIHELVAFLRFDQTLPRGQLTVDTRADPVVRANKVKLQQVLVNLVKNAADAIDGRPDGRITVALDRDGNEAVVSVADNGCGMTPETLSRIWEPFFTTKGAKGNGLGLDISRRLIETHGGRIDCDSAPGVGTTFVIRLPCVERPPDVGSEENIAPTDHWARIQEPLGGESDPQARPAVAGSCQA